MASLYRDPNSPFWYLKFKDRTGRWRSKSLRPLRHGIPVETRRAKAICDQHSLDEHTRSPARDSWASWVPAYIETRYADSPLSLCRVKQAWARLFVYLSANRILAPQDLTYRQCMDYLPYRKKKAAHNTAKLELTILGMLCEEAVRRGMIARNPAAKLGIKKAKFERPELTDDQIVKIREALKLEPAWMSHAFEIALHQGCRLNETALSPADIDCVTNRLHFRETKGGKSLTVPMHPALKPILQTALGRGQVTGRIFELPPNAARKFHGFFKKLGLPGITFHSTRVTVASRLAKSGYPMAKAMRVLGHSSQLIHRAYIRLQAEDVQDAYDHLKFPTDKP